MLYEIEHATTDTVAMVEPAAFLVIQRNGRWVISASMKCPGAAVLRRLAPARQPNLTDLAESNDIRGSQKIALRDTASPHSACRAVPDREEFVFTVRQPFHPGKANAEWPRVVLQSVGLVE